MLHPWWIPTLGAPSPRGTSGAEAATPAPRQSLCYYWSAWECAGGIFRAGCWPAWPPWELCLISPADVFDRMSAALVRRGAGVNPAAHVSREPCP